MTGYEVTVARLPLRAVFDLKGPAAALADWCGDALPAFPPRPHSLTRRGDAALCHTGPDRWLLLDDIAAEPTLDRTLRPAEAPPEISIVQVSDTLAFFAITGPDAAEIMATGCPLNLDAGAFPPDAASWTEMYGLKALILRRASGYEVAVERSLAPVLAEYLGHAAG